MGRIQYYKTYIQAAGVRGLVSAMEGKISNTPSLVQVSRPDIKFPFLLRAPSSDFPTYSQIFVRQEYNFCVKRAPRVIIDAGANIGLASIYFSNKFPDVKIIAIEPEESNLAILKRNVAPYENIIPISGALWHENARIDLVDPGLGKWAFMTQSQEGVEKRYGATIHEIRGLTVDMIMEEQGLDHIDILKIDIEGAEREVFRNSSSWIGKVDALIVELHERMKPGCNRSFYCGSNGFDNEWWQGENIYLTRSGGCLTRR
jgi:FkbM family methyltransferase